MDLEASTVDPGEPMRLLCRTMINAIILGTNLAGLIAVAFSSKPEDKLEDKLSDREFLGIRIALDEVGLNNVKIPSETEQIMCFRDEIYARLEVKGKKQLALAVRLGCGISLYDDFLQSQDVTCLDQILDLAREVGVSESCILALVQERSSIHQPDQADVLFKHIYSWEEPDKLVSDLDNLISILFIASDPSDLSRIRLGQEFREILEKLKLAKFRDKFQMELPQLSARPTDFTQALLDYKPHIVHFSGHGTTKGALCFENLLGEVQLIHPNALSALFEQFSTQVNCVILNSCFSAIQANAIAKHIDYVIGMEQTICDAAAIAFVIGFYQAIGAGCTIEQAYKLGCVQIEIQNIREDTNTPILIKKSMRNQNLA